MTILIFKMTAVCLRSKNTSEVETWSRVFSTYNTESKSCFFMKQLTKICVSTILYLRRLFPDEYFETKNFEGMDLKVLKFGKRYKKLDQIQQWLEGAFEAIDKKYLKNLMLDIKDANSEMTLEIYMMSFQYFRNQWEPNILLSSFYAPSEYSSEVATSSTQLKTIRLLQMCYAVTQSSISLPPQVSLSLRLSYHEETPQDYCPRGYKTWSPKTPSFPKNTRTIEFGITQSNYHSFRLISKSCFSDTFLKEEIYVNNKAKRKLYFNQTKVPKKQIETSINPTHPGDMIDSKKINQYKEEEAHKITEKKCRNTEEKCKGVPKLSQSSTHEMIDDSVQSLRTQSSSGFETKGSSNFDSEGKVRCPCRSSEKFSVMFLCSSCKHWVHADCFGVLQYDFSKKIIFYCDLCHKEEGPKCHDKVMCRLKDPSDRQKVAFLRRMLKFCNMPETVKITVKKMEKIIGSAISKKVAGVVLNKMIEIGVAMPQGKKKNFKINKSTLSERLHNYFYPLQYLNATLTKSAPLSIRTPEMMKRKNMDKSNSYDNTKHRKSSVFDSCSGSQVNSQFSRDLFQ